MLDPKKVKEWAEAVSAVGSSLFKFASVVGAMVAYIYCAFIVHFFPKGVSIGDSILFLFLAISFGLSYVLLTGLGFYMCFSLRWPFEERLGKSLKWFERWSMSVPGGLLLLLSLWACGSDLFHAVKSGGLSFPPEITKLVFSLVVSGWLMLYGTILWEPKSGNPANAEPTTSAEHQTPSTARTSRNRIAIIVVAVLMPALLGGSVLLRLAAQSFALLGISAEHATLIVNQKNFKTLETAAKLLKVPVFHCSIDGTDQTLVHNMRVLWNGVGEQSKVAFYLRPKTDAEAALAKVDLDRDGLQVVSFDKLLETTPTVGGVRSPTFETCLSLQSEVLFNTYADTPNAMGRKQLQDLQAEWRDTLADGNLKIVHATINGYADPVEIEKRDDDNEKLSQRRAEAVRNALVTLLQGVPVEVNGLGSTVSKAQCSETLSGQKLADCLVEDRRVEVRLKIEAMDHSTHASGSTIPAS